jgi:hypothetical protein
MFEIRPRAVFRWSPDPKNLFDSVYFVSHVCASPLLELGGDQVRLLLDQSCERVLHRARQRGPRHRWCHAHCTDLRRWWWWCQSLGFDVGAGLGEAAAMARWSQDKILNRKNLVTWVEGKQEMEEQMRKEWVPAIARLDHRRHCPLFPWISPPPSGSKS